MKRIILIFALFLLAAAFLFASQIVDDNAEGFNPYLPDSSIGANASDFALKDISGKKVSLSSFKGKPVLLNFWATWCGYCRRERAHLNTIYEEYKDKGLIIIAVSTDDSMEKVKSFLEKIPSDFIVLIDDDGFAASAYGVAGRFPTSFLIDRKGIIKHKFIGFREWTSNSSRKIIDNLVND